MARIYGPPKGFRKGVPRQNKRQTTIKVLKLFSERKMSKHELLQKAKDQNISHAAFTGVINRLFESKFLTANIELAKVTKRDFEHKVLMPFFSLNAPIPQILYLNDILDFLEQQFETWQGASTLKSFASSVLFSETSWKELSRYIKPEDEMKFLEAHLALSKIHREMGKEMVLDKFDEKEQQLILKYEETVEELIELIHSKSEDKQNAFEELKNAENDVDLQKVVADLEESSKMFDKVRILGIDPEELPQFFSNNNIVVDRTKTEPLIKWLKENRKIYSKYLEKQKESPKILLVIGEGFRDYIEEAQKLFKKVSGRAYFEWQLEEMNEKELADHKLKEKVKEMLECFEKANRSTLYRCESCSKLFNKRTVAENHVKRIHKTITEDSIVVEERAFYEKILKRLN